MPAPSVAEPVPTSALTRERTRSAWLFLAPTLLVAGWPLGRTIWFNFTDANLESIGEATYKWVGLSNYVRPYGVFNLDASLRVQTRLEIAKLHHPVNQFVAGFIGSPKMNFVPARLQEAGAQRARTLIGEVECQAEVDARTLPAGAPVTLGVRPEHVQVASGPGANAVAGLVAFVEQLGEASYLYVRLSGGELVTVRESGQSRIAVGTPIHLYFPPDCLHLFDAEGVAARRTVTNAGALGRPLLAGVSISRTPTSA